MNLADLFPPEYRESFTQRNIKPGTVIKVFVPDTNPPKEKRLIIMGVAYNKITLATVFINSEINEEVFPTKELQDLHVFFESEGRDYLNHDSFIDCSGLTSRNCQWLHSIITDDPARVIGELNEADYATLRNKIKGAPTITAATKKTYGLFL